MEHDIKKEYEVLKKKYNLPEFSLLDSEFEISSIDEPNFLVRHIRKKIDERVEYFCKILEGILQPDTCLSGLHECKFFNEQQKKDIYALYKKLMVMNRYAVELSILNNEQQDVSFILETVQEWDEIKKKLARYASQLKENWEKEIEVKEDVGYFG